MAKSALKSLTKDNGVIWLLVGLLVGWGLSYVLGTQAATPSTKNIAASCSISPSPAAPGQHITITGTSVPSGYAQYWWNVTNASSYGWLSAGQPSNGTLSAEDAIWQAGETKYSLFGKTSNGKSVQLSNACAVTIQ